MTDIVANIAASIVVVAMFAVAFVGLVITVLSAFDRS